MSDGDREYIGGWLVVEDWRLPWDACAGDRDVKVIGCGEIGEVRFALFRRAWGEVVRRDLEHALEAFAHRVGIEYSPAQRRRNAPHNDEVIDTGGKP